MHFGRSILAFDVVYNRETTEGKAFYWKNVAELKSLLQDESLDCGSEMENIAKKEYIYGNILRNNMRVCIN